METVDGVSYEERNLERRILELEAEMTEVLNAMRTGDYCTYLGHTYRMPSAVVRARIESGAGWEVARVCERCSHFDGHWETRHWTIRELVHA